MKFPRRRFLHLAAGVAALPLVPHIARAQAWPNRVVRLLNGFPAGGGNDAAARIVAGRLSEIWGQQVIVENKAGAAGNIAFETAARAAPDGYTMAFGYAGMAINPFLYASLAFDPIADFAPVTLIGTYGNLLVVPNSSPVRTLAEFVARAKANPGKMTYGSPGIGTTPHLAGELLKHRAGIELTHVPYRGVAAGGMSDLIAGRIESMFNTTGSLLQVARTGQVRGIAVTSAERPATASEFPTFAESGLPGFEVAGWYGLLVPAKTPPDIVHKINSDTVAVLGEPAIKARFDALGVTIVASSSDGLATRLRADTELWGPIFKAANIKGE
jgi:tripartite-type tricarboxylate transporter receptor subunit TctC